MKVRGKESITLTFVAASWIAITVVFIWKGGAADITTYSIAVGTLLTVWLGREWIEKVSVPKMEKGNGEQGA